MEDMSTENHAERIAESMGNGQRKQAVEQFKAAMFDHVNVKALLEEIAQLAGAHEALMFAATIIDNA